MGNQWDSEEEDPSKFSEYGDDDAVHAHSTSSVRTVQNSPDVSGVPAAVESTSIATPSVSEVPRVGSWHELEQRLPTLHGLWERRPMLSSASEIRWERIILTVDSGASDTVVPPSVCSLAPLHHTEKVGTEYEVANAAVLENLGERRCQMKTSENGKVLNMKWQVVDVHKPLLSVSKLTEQGHDVVFKPKEAYIQIAGGERLMLKKSGGVYEMEVWVRSPDFSGQS